MTESERIHRIIGTAVAGYRAFARGVASRDIRDRRMTKEEADVWVNESVVDFQNYLNSIKDMK